MIFNLECIICIRIYKDIIHIKFDNRIILQCIFNGVHLSHSQQVAHVYYQLFDFKMADGDQLWSVPKLEYDLLRRNASTNGRKTDMIERYIFHRKPKRTIYVRFFSILLYLLNVQAQGIVTIQVNILSMYKHIQGRTSFFTPARFKSCLFFKFLLIYSKPCLVQLPRPYSFKKYHDLPSTTSCEGAAVVFVRNSPE